MEEKKTVSLLFDGMLYNSGLLCVLKYLPVAQFLMLAVGLTVWLHAVPDRYESVNILWISSVALSITCWFVTARRDFRNADALNRTARIRHVVFSGALSALIAFFLLGRFNHSEEIIQVFLVGVSAGAMVLGWPALIWFPPIGAAWSLPFLGLSAWMLAQHIFFSLPMLFVLLLYSVYVVYTMFLFFVHWRESLIARIKAEERADFTRFLLRDFEDHATDWLWEADVHGCITYVSERVDGILGVRLQDIRHERIVDVMRRLFPQFEPEDHVRLDHLQNLLEQQRSFRDFSFRVWLQGEWRWWVISAKPLEHQSSIKGWRGVGRDITLDKLHGEEIERQANYDSLTGLPNRFYMRRLLDAFFIDAGDKLNIAFAMINVCNFKNINAIYGPAAGDVVLQEIGRRLQEFALRQSAIVSRNGGADFSVFVPRASEYAENQLDILLETLALPITTPSGSLEMSAKAGCVMGSESVSGSDYLIQCAELSLASAKESATSHLVRFDQKMADYRIWQMSLASELRYAVQKNEIFALFQPQISVASGRLVGAEALIRWNSQRVGLVSPIDFIPLAEKNGQIVEVGEWILEYACRCALEWPEYMKVSVNVSAIQLMQIGFVSRLLSVVEKTELPLHRLLLEITESALINDVDKVKKVVVALRGRGVGIALDDFGTGYSSLSYLSKYPVSELKIDQSFIRTMETSADSVKIVETIIQLAHNLNFTTTAEGVETEKQAGMLRDMGCDVLQGYLFGRPMSQMDLMEMAGAVNPV